MGRHRWGTSNKKLFLRHSKFLFYHTHSETKQLQCLPISQQIIFKLLLIVHKALNGKAPHYISELLQVYTPSRNLWSSSKLPLIEPMSWYSGGGQMFFFNSLHHSDLVFVPQNSNLFWKLTLCHRFSRTNLVFFRLFLVYNAVNKQHAQWGTYSNNSFRNLVSWVWRDANSLSIRKICAVIQTYSWVWRDANSKSTRKICPKTWV